MESFNETERINFFLSLLPAWQDMPKSLSYQEVKIPKGKGEFRTLHIPDEKLMKSQKVILEEILYQLPISPAAHCAIKRRSVVTNVQPHLTAKAFFKIDFKDAFPSVSKKMVVEHLTPLFIQCFPNFPTEKLKSFVELLSTRTTYKNSLPQGAPTSPCLLNLVCYQLDMGLIALSNKFNLTYTRYADDLWFSSKDSKIPKEARRAIVKAVIDYGFKLNRSKISYKTGKATVPKITGVTFVQKNKELQPSIPRKKLEEYRAKIHQAAFDPEIATNEIFGIMGWITMVTGKIPERLKKPFRDFLSQRCPEKTPHYNHLF